MAHQKQHLSQTGFSMLELSMVIAIIAVLVAFGLNIGRNAQVGAENLNTREKLAVIQTALEEYVARNNYLPCPASISDLASDTTSGFERRNSTADRNCDTTSGVTLASNTFHGAIPFRTLGLGDSFLTDAWGRRFMYAVGERFVGSAAYGMNGYYATTGNLIIRRGTRASYSTLSTTSTGVPGAGATYVVISTGRDGRGMPRVNGGTTLACGAIATRIDVENCDRSNEIFFDNPINDGKQDTTRFDDYVVWGSNKNKQNPATVQPNVCGAACETWCAPCTISKGASYAVPATGTRVCNKFLISTAPCQAVCIWPGATLPCP